jgi:hypothetical protein
MPAYVPPHLRRLAALEQPKKRGVHFPSNRTGEPAENEKHYRYSRNGRRTPTRSEKAHAESRRLARRQIAVRPRKGLLKGKKTIKRHVRSAEPVRRSRTLKKGRSV